MKKFLRNVCLLVTVAVMSCAVFAAQGCGIIGGGKEEDDAKVLRIGVYQKQTEVNVIKAVIAAFKKAYPDYLAEQGLSDIKIREIAESEYTTKIQGMAQTGTLPDVFLNIDATAPMFATQKVSLDLMPYVEANEEYADIIADMYAPMYAQGVFSGEFHMAAREYSRVVMYYNKTLLSEVGLAAPQNDWTWNDFTDYATKLVKKSGTGVVQNGAELQLQWPANVLPVIKGLGGALFDEQGNAVIDESTANAYAQLKKLTDSGAVANTFKGIGTSFANKTIAMFASTRAAVNDMIRYFGKDSSEWGVVCFPDMRGHNGGNAYIGTGTSGYSVSARSTHKDAAVKFLMFMLSEEGQKALSSTGSFVPVRKSMANSACWTSDLNIGLPADFNHEAFTYNSDYDLEPFGMMVKDPAKSAKVQDEIFNMSETTLSYGTDYEEYGYSDLSGWIEYWNGAINACYN